MLLLVYLEAAHSQTPQSFDFQALLHPTRRFDIRIPWTTDTFAPDGREPATISRWDPVAVLDLRESYRCAPSKACVLG